MKGETTMRVKVTVNPDGSLAIEAEGFNGKTCEEALKWLEAEVGKFETTTKKAEYFQPEVQVKQKQWGKL
jgi:hypothetical protein